MDTKLNNLTDRPLTDQFQNVGGMAMRSTLASQVTPGASPVVAGAASAGEGAGDVGASYAADDSLTDSKAGNVAINQALGGIGDVVGYIATVIANRRSGGRYDQRAEAQRKAKQQHDMAQMAATQNFNRLPRLYSGDE